MPSYKNKTQYKHKKKYFMGTCFSIALLNRTAKMSNGGNGNVDSEKNDRG